MWSLTASLSIAAICSAAVGVAVILRRARRRAPGAADLVLGLAAATAAMLTAVSLYSLATPGQLQPFGVFHVLYDGVLVTLPLIGVVVGAVAIRRRSRPPTLLACAALALLGLLGWYTTHIEPNWLRVDTIDVPVDPAREGDGEVRIAVLADLQTPSAGSHERDAVRSIMDGRPDVIVIPGDLYQPTAEGFFDGIAGVQELLASLHAPYGVYFTQGDHEDLPLAHQLLDGTDVRILDDEVVELRVRERRVLLGGTSSSVGSPGADAVRARLDAEPDDGATTVLVSHRPDTVLHLPQDARVDLTIAGHTHGGQVVVPGIGPLVTLTEVPRDVARGGLHEVDGNRLYVSPGVGLERGDAPQMRLFNRPAVALLDLAG